jgi:hypothetical protein
VVAVIVARVVGVFEVLVTEIIVVVKVPVVCVNVRVVSVTDVYDMLPV